MVEENENTEDEELNEEGEEFEEISFSSDVNRKKIIMILLPLLLVIGAAVGIYFSGIADDFLRDITKQTKNKGTEQALANKEVVNTVFYDLPEMIVNLQSSEKRRSGLMMIKVSLEIEDEADIPRIEEVLPRITDTFITHLREIRPEELDGSSGVYRLKEELLYRVNRAVKPAKVYNIRFKQFEIH